MHSLVRLSRHTHTTKCNEPAKIRENYCGLTILIVPLFSRDRLRITTQLRSDTVDKMAGMFTKRIWQPYPAVIRRPGNFTPLLPPRYAPAYKSSNPRLMKAMFLPLYAFLIRRLLYQIFGWCSVLMLIHVSCTCLCSSRQMVLVVILIC